MLGKSEAGEHAFLRENTPRAYQRGGDCRETTCLRREGRDAVLTFFVDAVVRPFATEYRQRDV